MFINADTASLDPAAPNATTQQLMFVNANPHSRDKSASRAIRAHVTKVNFAKRRRRLENAYTQQKRQDEVKKAQEQASRLTQLKGRGGHLLPHTRQQTSPVPSTRLELIDPFSVCLQYRAYHNRSESSLRSLLTPHIVFREFRPLIFPCLNGYQNPKGELSWVNLLMAEPALVEASMAVGLKHNMYFQQAETAQRLNQHTYNAVKMVNQRLAVAQEQLSDGLLAAVFVLSFGEVSTRCTATHFSISAVNFLTCVYSDSQEIVSYGACICADSRS